MISLPCPFRLGRPPQDGFRPRAIRWALGLLVAVALGLPLGSAQAQDASPQAVVTRGVEAGLDRAQLQEVVRRAESAGVSADATADLLQPAVRLAENGLPAQHVLNKALEGLAKRVPASRMSPVLQQLSSNTEQAGGAVNAWIERPDVREALGVERGGPPDDIRAQLIVNAAQAQQQGVPPAFVQSLLNDLPAATSSRPLPAQNVAVAVGILPDMPGAVDGSASTRELLTAALNAGYDAESMRQLPAALQSASRSSERPPAALARGTAQAIANGTPAADVLRGLFQGNVPGLGPPSGVGPPGGQPPGQGVPPGRANRPPGKGPPDNPPGQGDPPGGGGGGSGG